MCTEINPFLHTKANWRRNLQTCNACRLPYLVHVVLEAKTDNLFSSTSLLHPTARTHPVLIWRQVELSSRAKTCTHASSHHFSLWKHSHRVSDWLATSSHHKTDFMNHWLLYTLSGLSGSRVWHTATRPQRRYRKFSTTMNHCPRTTTQ